MSLSGHLSNIDEITKEELQAVYLENINYMSTFYGDNSQCFKMPDLVLDLERIKNAILVM